MQYYVIAPDGSKYGPADVSTLKQWAAENRLSADTQLEDFGTGQRMLASAVAGIFSDQPTTAPGAAPNMGPATGSPYSQAPTMGTVYNQNQQQVYDNGQSELTLSWIFSAVGIFCCGLVFCLLGFWKANQAEAKGNPNAKSAKIFSIVALVIWLGWTSYRVVVAINAINAAGAAGGRPFGQ